MAFEYNWAALYSNIWGLFRMTFCLCNLFSANLSVKLVTLATELLSCVHTGPICAVSCCVSDKQKNIYYIMKRASLHCKTNQCERYIKTVFKNVTRSVAGSKMGEGFVCDIAAVDFDAVIDCQKFEKSYIAKFAPEGPKGIFIKEVSGLDRIRVFRSF